MSNNNSVICPDCDKLAKRAARIRLVADYTGKPIPNKPFTLLKGEAVIMQGVSDGNGVSSEEVLTTAPLFIEISPRFPVRKEEVEFFKQHRYDSLTLHRSTKSLAECKPHLDKKYGKVVDVPILTAECLWHRYQKEAEEIVGQGGELIADPIERNKRINQTYAKIWLKDDRFQWAGLAAFASKQVGCGLVNFSDAIENAEGDKTAKKRAMMSAAKVGVDVAFPQFSTFMSAFSGTTFIQDIDKAIQDGKASVEARKKNKVTEVSKYIEIATVSGAVAVEGATYETFKFSFNMMGIGNATLFLDVYPLHAFYHQRGLKEFEACLRERKNIYGNSQFPILWPIEQDKLIFGYNFPDILPAFKAIDEKRLADGVRHLADHEQKNILEAIMYSDWWLVGALWGNQVFHTLGNTSITQPVELPLAAQCKSTDDGRTIEFTNGILDGLTSRLSNVENRMEFVYKAATRFDEMLRGDERSVVTESLKEIASNGGVK
ncbi:DUF2515 family protein [Xenorhabdus bovienii]|uniref:Uncharacterized protein n=2 Tax=Xenorhabdus bovienii TaxID=40576 RepID=A0A077QFF3_XENBV|nr:hypothetical protein [Xenorhabdus bovienii]CDH34777.1 conserved hypothetical protein [Xenorhabdus bovienii str. Intermedium]